MLVNITGGDDLTLFEVEESVNRIRAEVDPEAELIFGAIEDTELYGKIRVSIVATALDGHKTENKTVLNMVSRIQNRNTGYSENLFSHNPRVENNTLNLNNGVETGQLILALSVLSIVVTAPLGATAIQHLAPRLLYRRQNYSATTLE